MQNPQQDPGMERRLLLVFALTFAVLLISQPLLMKYLKPQQPAPEQKPAATQPAALRAMETRNRAPVAVCDCGLLGNGGVIGSPP